MAEEEEGEGGRGGEWGGKGPGRVHSRRMGAREGDDGRGGGGGGGEVRKEGKWAVGFQVGRGRGPVNLVGLGLLGERYRPSAAKAPGLVLLPMLTAWAMMGRMGWRETEEALLPRAPMAL